jgi:hypothetical protein
MCQPHHRAGLYHFSIVAKFAADRTEAQVSDIAGFHHSIPNSASRSQAAPAKTQYTDARPILRALAISVGFMPSAFILRTRSASIEAGRRWFRECCRRARWIGKNAAAVATCGIGHQGFLDLPRPHDVEHALSRREQIIGNDPPMASPPNALRAHDGAVAPARERPQAIEPALERLARGVVGIVVKALVLPERIRRRGHLPLPAAQAAEFSDVSVVDAVSRQGLRQYIEIELRIGARTRDSAHVRSKRHVRLAQQRDELVYRAVGMSYRKECRSASGHVEARCLCAWRGDRSCRS